MKKVTATVLFVLAALGITVGAFASQPSAVSSSAAARTAAIPPAPRTIPAIASPATVGHCAGNVGIYQENYTVTYPQPGGTVGDYDTYNSIPAISVPGAPTFYSYYMTGALNNIGTITNESGDFAVWESDYYPSGSNVVWYGVFQVEAPFAFTDNLLVTVEGCT